MVRPVTAAEIIAALGLARHPEGGWYRQTWVANGAGPNGLGRPAGSSIYFLLQAGEVSHWHRFDATEVWHFHGGAALELRMSKTDLGPSERQVLGLDLASGARPQAIVPAGWWQSARSLGDWTLVGCSVAPAFDFAAFELAAPGFDISLGPSGG
jgi:uncharacterized protein